ncbi:hypothetical protein NM208_g10183 [Fusarium decemcellulare]|uniref:Uncharacterized protein n=1 Tax=Fusarium decemcellulare TaxID=57161 RepID=A0ACC1RYX3_9HYPO|nr:hypothetical protein NM208_g10183 [Fusarium decemcellulare]
MFQKRRERKPPGWSPEKNLGHRAQHGEWQAAASREGQQSFWSLFNACWPRRATLGYRTLCNGAVVWRELRTYTQQLVMVEMRGSIRHLVLIAMTPQAFGVGRELERTSWGVLGRPGAGKGPCPGLVSS